MIVALVISDAALVWIGLTLAFRNRAVREGEWVTDEALFRLDPLHGDRDPYRKRTYLERR